MKDNKQIEVHIASDAEMDRVFVQAWHQAEEKAPSVPEEHLFFEDAASLLKVLSNLRLALLSTLLKLGECSIRALSKELQRNYKNVHGDVQLLKQAGLIRETQARKIFVPWRKINTEIDLAA